MESEVKVFKSFFKTVGGNEGTLCKYPTRLDTYGCGCFHDCSFCYGKSLLEFRHLWDAENPAVADLKAIERKIARLPEGMTVRMGGMTDCFQPCETEHRVTYETIKMLNERGIHQLIVTKSHLPATDKYLEILSPKYSHLQFSVTNTDDDYALEYERASKSSKRLEAMKICADAGLDSCLRLSPYIHGWIDLETVAKYDPPKVLMEFLRVNTWIAKWFGQRVDLNLWTVKTGNYRHLPLSTKIEQVNEVRLALPNTHLSVCEDDPMAYEYWKANVNCNPEDCCNLRK